jgi:hypothetical protein
VAIVRPPLPQLAFTMIPNAWVRDPALDPNAFRILADILSHAEGYRLSVAQIMRETGIGRDGVEAAIKRMKARGYLVAVEQPRAERGRFGENDYTVTSVTDRVPRPPSTEEVPSQPELPGANVGTAPLRSGTAAVEDRNGARPPRKKNTLGEEHSETPTESQRAGSHLAPVPDLPTAGQRADRLAREHYEAAGKLGGSRAFMGLRGIVAEAVQAGHSDQQIKAALAHLRGRGRAVTRAALGPLLTEGNGARKVPGSNYGPSYMNPDPTDPANRGAFDGAF